MLWEDAVSFLAVLYGIVPFVYALTSNMRVGVVWGACVIGSSMLAEGIKRISREWDCEWCRRPAGATDCNTRMNNGAQGGAPGFPSGHTATAAAFWSGAWVVAAEAYRPAILVVGAVAVLGMAAARLKKRCHTVLQTVGGGLLGTALIYTTRPLLQ